MKPLATRGEESPFHVFFLKGVRAYAGNRAPNGTSGLYALRQSALYPPESSASTGDCPGIGTAGIYTKMEELLDVLARPYEERERYASYMLPPKPEERIFQTFCGT